MTDNASRTSISRQAKRPGKRTGRETANGWRGCGGPGGGGGWERVLLGDFIGKLGMPSCFTESSVDLTSNCMLERQ